MWLLCHWLWLGQPWSAQQRTDWIKTNNSYCYDKTTTINTIKKLDEKVDSETWRTVINKKIMKAEGSTINK